MPHNIRFDIVDPQSDDALWSMRSYFDELASRFPDGFEPGDTLTVDAEHFRAPHGRFVVARSIGADGDEDVAGCGGVQVLEPHIAEIKRMWISPGHRGQGVGGRLLAQLEQVAAGLESTVVRLDTNSALTEAIAMYTGRGYVDIDAYNDNPYALRWFEKPIDSSTPS